MALGATIVALSGFDGSEVRAQAAVVPTAAQRSAARRKARSRAAAHIPVRHSWTSPSSGAALLSDLTALLPGPVSGRFGAMVVSLTRGDTLFMHDAGTQVLPASTMKLFTSALALERLGPDHRFSTEVLRDGGVGADGALRGNLILRGDGDPSLSPRLLGGLAADPMAMLARGVAAAGIKRITGDIIADGSAFDDRRVPEGWRKRYLQSAYAARVSALSLNENLVWVVVRPGAKHAEVWLEPASSALPIINNVKVVAGRGGKVWVRRGKDGAFDVRGTIGAQSFERRWSLVVEDPATFTAGVLKTALENAGVRVGGTVKPGVAPLTAARVAVLPSPPLADIVAAMNGESINLFAELLFRASARGPDRIGVGSADNAHAELMRFLTQKVGVDAGAVMAKDGSGLSTLDRVTPRSLVKVLAYANKAPWAAAYHASLPVAGQSETLRHRMRSTPAQGNLHAKTGTTNEVISLAGYVTARNGEVLAFAIVYNGRDRWRAKERIDRAGATLASFSRE